MCRVVLPLLLLVYLPLSEGGRSPNRWCNKIVKGARASAIRHGLSAELVMMRTQHLYMQEMMARFPDVDIAKALEKRWNLSCKSDLLLERSNRPHAQVATQTWAEWLAERVNDAREYASQYGTNVQEAMLHILTIHVDDAMDKFPGIELSRILKDMAGCAIEAERDTVKQSKA